MLNDELDHHPSSSLQGTYVHMLPAPQHSRRMQITCDALEFPGGLANHFCVLPSGQDRFAILGAELTVNLANWYNVLRALFSVQAFVHKLANVTRPVYCAVSSGTSKNPV